MTDVTLILMVAVWGVAIWAREASLRMYKPQMIKVRARTAGRR